MSSQIAVGLVGHNGRLGSSVLTALLKHKDLRVVVLHRPSSDLGTIPTGTEKRVLDLEKGSPEEIEKAIEGLQVVM
jgi:dihydrodipicolinate reductase